MTGHTCVVVGLVLAMGSYNGCQTKKTSNSQNTGSPTGPSPTCSFTWTAGTSVVVSRGRGTQLISVRSNCGWAAAPEGPLPYPGLFYEWQQEGTSGYIRLSAALNVPINSSYVMKVDSTAAPFQRIAAVLVIVGPGCRPEDPQGQICNQ